MEWVDPSVFRWHVIQLDKVTKASRFSDSVGGLAIEGLERKLSSQMLLVPMSIHEKMYSLPEEHINLKLFLRLASVTASEKNDLGSKIRCTHLFHRVNQ